MSNIIQSLVDEGVFDQDPDGLLWLSAKMKDVVSKLEQNEKFLALLEEIENPLEKALKRWSILYLTFIGVSDEKIMVKAGQVLVAWEFAAKSKRLFEWSMKLRIS